MLVSSLAPVLFGLSMCVQLGYKHVLTHFACQAKHLGGLMKDLASYLIKKIAKKNNFKGTTVDMGPKQLA